MSKIVIQVHTFLRQDYNSYQIIRNYKENPLNTAQERLRTTIEKNFLIFFSKPTHRLTLSLLAQEISLLINLWIRSTENPPEID